MMRTHVRCFAVSKVLQQRAMLTKQEVSSAGLNLERALISAPDGRALISWANMSVLPRRDGLTGPNGCGKSTLLRAIAMLHPVDGGTISLGRLRRSSDRSGFLSQLVFMPQNFPVFPPTMKATGVPRLPLRLRGAATAQARAIAAEMASRRSAYSLPLKRCAAPTVKGCGNASACPARCNWMCPLSF